MLCRISLTSQRVLSINRAVAKAERVMLPQVKLLCPLSTSMLGSKKVEPHYSIASLCANGSVHIYCVVHMFKGFVSHPAFLEAWNVAKQGNEAAPRPAVRPGGSRT